VLRKSWSPYAVSCRAAKHSSSQGVVVKSEIDRRGAHPHRNKHVPGSPGCPIGPISLAAPMGPLPISVLQISLRSRRTRTSASRYKMRSTGRKEGCISKSTLAQVGSLMPRLPGGWEGVKHNGHFIYACRCIRAINTNATQRFDSDVYDEADLCRNPIRILTVLRRIT
jgi:hypothetical protein